MPKKLFPEKKLSSVVITQVIDSIPWVRCASGNVYILLNQFLCNVLLKHFCQTHKSNNWNIKCVWGKALSKLAFNPSVLDPHSNPVMFTIYANALCGYPLVKVAVEKICSFAPILLRFGYFRQNIWRLSSAQFHF